MKKLAVLLLALALVGCGPPEDVQPICPEGLYYEWDDGECETLVDALDLDESHRYRTATPTRRPGQPAPTARPRPAAPKPVVKPQAPKPAPKPAPSKPKR